MDVHACVESGMRPRPYHAVVPLARPDCTMLPRFDALLIDMDGTLVDSRALGVAPDRCIVIEDADAGIAAGWPPDGWHLSAAMTARHSLLPTPSPAVPSHRLTSLAHGVKVK